MFPLDTDPSTEQAVQNAVDVAQLLLAAAIGIVAGVVAGALLNLLFHVLTRRSPLLVGLLRRARAPFYWAMAGWGAYVGVAVALSMQELADSASTVWVRVGRHALLIICICLSTWALYSACWIIEDAAKRRQRLDLGNASRFETQAQVLRRLLQVVVVLIGIGGVLFTFPGAQQALTALFASAGVLGVVAGLAAQSTLGNVFAGLQLAFTDAIRVGDVVVAGPDKQQGAVEEITLTYVVIRVWDERRLIMPSTNFTTTAFENWTRRAAKQQGIVELKLDWNAPMALIRQKVEQLLLATDLWDGRTWNVQMTESDQDTVTVRIVVSAVNSATLWDLRCYLRENLVEWITTEEPWARSAHRLQELKAVTVEKDQSREAVARLARELSDIAGTDTGAGAHGGGPEEGVTQVMQREDPEAADAVHAARLHAARRKAKKARRRSLFARQAEKSGTGVMPAVRDASVHEAPTATHVFTATEQAELAKRYDLGASAAGERLFSGDPEAEERAKVYEGPGEDVLREREQTAQMRASRAKAPADGDGAPGAGAVAKDADAKGADAGDGRAESGHSDS